MSEIQDRINELKDKREQKEQGKFFGVPLYESFPRLGEYLPSIPRGCMIMLTANSGVGKTQGWKGIFLKTVIDFIKNHPDAGIKPHFLLFLLEETKNEFIDSLFSMLLYENYKLVIDPLTLNSEYKHLLPKETLELLDKIQDQAEFIMNFITIEDSIYNPTGCYKYARTKSLEWGNHYYSKLHYNDEVIDHTEYNSLQEHKKEEYKYSHYTPNDSQQVVFLVCDNMNLFNEESNLTQHQTIGRWCKDYCRKQISKHWNWIILNIMQQTAESEKQQFSLMTGKSVVTKLKPSLEGLGNNKESQRDHLVILGLFAPARYDLETYAGYNITKMGDSFRSLIILKNRIGKTNLELPLYFNGAVNFFKELEKPGLIDYNKLV